MERPRTGHRHDQEGSIAVVDLIRRQASPIRIPSADETETNQFVSELLGPASAEAGRQRGKLAKAAKLIGLVIGSLVLCGSVAAAAVLARSRPTNSEPVVAAPTPITGIGVLRPDTLEAQLSGHPPAAARSKVAATPSSPAHYGNKADRPSPTGKAVQPPAAPATGQPLAPTPANPQALVREFYQLVTSQPGIAAQLISPSLLPTDLTGFINAWQSATRVEVDSVQVNPNGTVQAAVRLLRSDGSWLRVVELLHVTQGSQPLISGAELLSEQNG